MVDLWMNQAVEKMTRRPWPRSDDGQPLGMTAIQQPCELTLHLPSTKTLRLTSKQTILQQEGGIVTLVSVLPLEAPLDFGSALAKAQETARKLEISDRKLLERLSHWSNPSDGNKSDPKYMARARVEPGVNLYVKMLPTNDDTGWFIALEFHRAVA
jgi:hypothetical protein